MNLKTPAHSLTTAELAAWLNLRPQTIRKRYSATGSYFGVVPKKGPNRLLLWPADSVEQLAGDA
ncbi:DNA-binding protein [Paraburkholderia sp. 40]|uniref:DNA-binding protein n=1 Tax=Paraburkholderia sp. 40 TaxID=2991059 RepID=UPI003D214B79